MRSVETIKGLIASTDRRAEQKDKEIQETHDRKKAATAEILKQLEDIKKPFNEQLEKLEGEYNRIQSEKNALSTELYNAQQQQTIRAMHAPEGELTYEGVKAYLNGLGIKGYQFEQKMKPLKNGLHIWKEYDEYVGRKYFVFHKRPLGWTLVAYWTRAESENPGDWTEGYAWLGQEKLTKKNEMRVLEDARCDQLEKTGKVAHDDGEPLKNKLSSYDQEHAYHRRTQAKGRYGSSSHRYDVDALTFIRELKKADADKLLEIDVKDEDNIKQMNSHYIIR